MMVGPGEGVLEGGVLACFELGEVDYILGEKIFVFPGQPNIMQTRIVGADGDIHPGFAALVKDDTQC